MYAKNDLYWIYRKNNGDDRLSHRLPDVTKKFTLEVMNSAINLCPKWDNFLDIGASTGHYSIPFLHKFRKGTAVEATSNVHLDNLSKKYKNLTVRNGFIQKMDFKEKFDFILMADVFEHIPETDLVDFVSRVSFLQEAGGIVYILTPNPTFCGPACETELFHDGGKLDHFGHYKHYHPSEITRLFSEHNYEKIIESYEEGILKNYFKRYVFSISIRDRKYSKNIFYKMISPIFIWIPQIAFNIIEKIVYHNEWKNKNNDIKSMSYVVVFKKLK